MSFFEKDRRLLPPGTEVRYVNNNVHFSSRGPSRYRVVTNTVRQGIAIGDIGSDFPSYYSARDALKWFIPFEGEPRTLQVRLTTLLTLFKDKKGVREEVQELLHRLEV